MFSVFLIIFAERKSARKSVFSTMELTQTYSNSLLETMGILNVNTLRLSKFIWEKYEKFAIKKLENYTVKIRGTYYYLNNLTPKQAQHELETLKQFEPLLSPFKQQLESIDRNEFVKFRNTAMDFFNALEDVTHALTEIADVHSSYKSSIPTLAKGWDSKEDEHWDNY